MGKKTGLIDLELFRARQALNETLRGLNRDQILQIIGFVMKLKGKNHG
jgi:hypothetical protein